MNEQITTPRCDADIDYNERRFGLKFISPNIGRDLEIENQQLQRDKENQRLAKEGAVKIAEGLLSDRNHFKQLAGEWEKMAGELVVLLRQSPRPENNTAWYREWTRASDDAISRFHSLQQPQKKDE